MLFRTKLIIALSISLVAVIGIIFVLVQESGPGAQSTDPGTPELTEPVENLEEEVPVETVSAPKKTRAREAPAPEALRTFRPLLAVGGWKLTGRIVRVEEEALGGEGPQLPGAEPVAGVRVRLKPHPRHPTDNPIAVHERVTGRDGLFEFAGVPGDAWLRIEIDERSSAYRTLSFRMGDPGAEGHKDLGDVPIEPGTRLSFHVEGPGGAPVDKGTILVNVASSNPRRSQRLRGLGISESRRRAAEQGEGVYVLDRAASGDMYAEVKAPGHSPSGRINFSSPLDEPLVVALEEGYTIAGVVIDLDENPIVAAELETGPSGNRDRIKSDEEGRFLFDGLGPGEHSIRAKAEGYVEIRERNVPTGTDDLQFKLAPEAIVVGKVLAQDGGEAVPEATVTIREQTTRSSHRADSREDGSFEIRGVPEGTFTVTVDHASFAPRSVEEPITLEIGARHDAGSILLAEGLEATGRIVETESEAPVTGAEVDFRLQGGGSSSSIASRKVTSDAEGLYVAKGLSEGTYAVTVKSKGYLDGKPQVVTIAEDGERSFDFTLELGSAIEGKVADPDGKPISGVTVRPNVSMMPGGDWSELNENFNNIFNTQVQTDAEGRYRLEGLRSYGSYTVEASHQSYARTKVRKLDLKPRSTLTDVDVTLARGGSVSGRVLDSGGEGVSGASVTASIDRAYNPAEEREWVSFGNNRSATTDEEGSYRLEHLAEGAYTIRVQSSRNPSQTAEVAFAPALRQGIEVIDEKETERINIEVGEGVSLAGQVVDSDGEPIAGARVRIYDQISRTAQTDAEGMFHVEGLREGQMMQLRVSMSGYVSKSVQVSLPARENIVVTLDQSGRVRGRVVSSEVGAFTTFRIVSTALDSNGRGNSSREVRDATGRFELELGPGRYQLVAMVTGFAPSKSAEFTVVKGETLEDVEIELTSGGSVEGVVVDRTTGEAVANARISLQPTGRDDSYLSWGGAPGARTDAEGSFVLEGVPVDATISLQVTHAKYAQQTVTGVVVGAEEPAVVRVELGGGGAIGGLVTRDGKPVQGARVFAYSQNASASGATRVNKNAVTDAQGRYELNGLPEGVYSVNMSLPAGGRSRGQTATVVDGESTELNFDEAAGVRVFGKVYEGGRPAGSGRIQAMHPSRGFSSGSGSIDGSGNYSLEVPGAGSYSLMINWRGPGENGARVTLDVPAGRSEVEFDIDLPGGGIVGAVVDAENGAGIERAMVIALLPGQATESMMSLFRSMQSMAQTDGQGQFAIRNVAEGTYTLRVFTQGYADGRVDRVRVARGNTDAGEVALERGIAFRVHVTSPDRKPLAGAMALLRDAKGSLVGLIRPVSSNAQGVAEIESIHPGDYRVTVVHPSYAPATIEARVEDGGDEPEVRLERGGELTVRVVDSRGRAAAEAEVHVLDESGRNVLEDSLDFRRGPTQGNLTDRTGTLSVKNVKPGSYRALASLPGAGRSEEVDVEISRDKPARIDLELEE